jgi:hypothetical protein
MEKLSGPGIIFLYPETSEGKPIQFPDAVVTEWPSPENQFTITFLYTEPNVARQVGRTRMPYFYCEKVRKGN